MTHLMQWQAALQHPGALRASVAATLRMLGQGLERLAARVEQRKRAHSLGVVEFAAVEMGGRMVGGYYVDGELVAVVPDVTRL